MFKENHNNTQGWLLETDGTGANYFSIMILLFLNLILIIIKDFYQVYRKNCFLRLTQMVQIL